MARMSELIATESKYIKAADLQGREAKVRISSLVVDEVEPGKHKPILHFVGKERGLVINQTNGQTLIDLFGDDTANYAGHEVILYVVKTNNPRGEVVDGIRLRGAQPLQREEDLPF